MRAVCPTCGLRPCNCAIESMLATADLATVEQLFCEVEDLCAYSDDQERDEQGRFSGPGRESETPRQTFARVDRDMAERRERLSVAIGKLPAGTRVKGWVKQPNVPDVPGHWSKGRRTVLDGDVVTETGAAAFVPLIGHAVLGLRGPEDLEAEWDESQHPRDERGRFGEGGGGVTVAHDQEVSPSALGRLFEQLEPKPLPAFFHQPATHGEVRDAAKAAGVRYRTWDELDPHLRQVLAEGELKMHASAQMSALHVAAMPAIHAAFERIDQVPEYRDALKQGRGALAIPVMVADYEPASAMATMITGPPGTPLMVLNSAYMGEPGRHFEHWWGVPGKGITYGARRAEEMLAAGATHEAAAAELFKLVTYHEIGHAVDHASHGKMTDYLLGELGSQFHRGEREQKVPEWLAKNISRYASSNPKDATAEAFTMLMDGQHLPQELRHWERMVPGTEAYRERQKRKRAA